MLRAQALTQILLLAVLPIAFRCASTTYRSPSEVWQATIAERLIFEGARSYAKIRVVTRERSMRFNARIAVARDGRMEMSGLSPFGTALFTLNFDGESVTLQDHREKTVWSGSAAELPEIVGLQGSFSTRALPFLLLALPPDSGWPANGEDSGGLLRIASGSDRAIVSGRGLIELVVDEDGGAIVAAYSLPSSPPTNITIRPVDGVERVEIQHIDLSFGPVEIEPVTIDPSYRRIE